MDPLAHLDLLSVGVAVAGTTLLGVIILLNDFRSATNRAFFYFAAVTAMWSVANYMYYQVSAGSLALLLLRLVIFFATWHALTFFNLTYIFPANRVALPKWYQYMLVPFVAAVSVLTLTPLVFEQITSQTASGAIGGIKNGPGIPIFGTTVGALIIAGIFLLTRKTIRAGKSRRTPYAFLLGGMFITFFLLLLFNLVLPAAFNNPRYIPLGALFLLPFILSSAFAILRYRLLNIRAAAIGLLSFFLSVGLFIDVIFATTIERILFTASEFVLVLIFSYWLIQGVVRETKQREKIEMLARDLETANEQQVALIHFITHQLKGFVAKSRNIFAMIAEGDYGPVPETMKPMIDEGFSSATKGAQTIQEILNAANIKSGKVAYDMKPFDFKELVESIIGTLKPNADAKHVSLTLSAPAGPVMFTGDRMQLENALKNLVDNSIKYTPQGSIEATLTEEGGTIRFTTKDTGVGITPEDMQRLFTEGGHGAESQKVNVDSTGFGLYIVKNIIEGHGGKVWAESAGAGKGSTFVVELPMK